MCLDVQFDSALVSAPTRGEKPIGVYVALVNPEIDSVTIKATLRVVNLRDPSVSWTKTFGPKTIGGETISWGFKNCAPSVEARLPTAHGPMYCVQVISIEVTDPDGAAV